MTNPEVASLARELAIMQRQLRDLAIGNPLNSAEVVDASGNSVLLSSLAFGSVPATDNTLAEMTGTANTVGGVGWFAFGPAVWVQVTGGKLRFETDGSTDMAEWFSRRAVAELQRVKLVDIAMRMAGIY